MGDNFVLNKKYTGLFYGEAKKERKLLNKIVETKKFKYFTQNWEDFIIKSYHGESPEMILESCNNFIKGRAYDIVLCFVDIDKLKQDCYSKKSKKIKNWEKEKIKLENKYNKIIIVWQDENLEDEIKKVIGKKAKTKSGNDRGKWHLTKLSRENVEKIASSEFWKNIFKIIKGREGN